MTSHNYKTSRSHVLGSSHKLSWTPSCDLGWVEAFATPHLAHLKHFDADLDLFWPCRYQIEVAKSYQIETKQDHA